MDADARCGALASSYLMSDRMNADAPPVPHFEHTLDSFAVLSSSGRSGRFELAHCTVCTMDMQLNSGDA